MVCGRAFCGWRGGLVGVFLLVWGSCFGAISRGDSLVREMSAFLRPGAVVSAADREAIEARIKGFERRVVRRDTVAYFLRTAYAVGYYEFVSKDFVEAKKWVDDFIEQGLPPYYVDKLMSYPSVGELAGMSLGHKVEEGEKPPLDPNSWLKPAEEKRHDYRRNCDMFFGEFIEDLPTDLAAETFRQALTTFKAMGGLPGMINGMRNTTFYTRCRAAGRADVFDIICELWEADATNFVEDERGRLLFKQPISGKNYAVRPPNFPAEIDTTWVNNYVDIMLLYEVDELEAQIDSLIARGEMGEEVGRRVIRLLWRDAQKLNNEGVLATCRRRGEYLSGIDRAIMESYRGWALHRLGRNEEALEAFKLCNELLDSEEERTISRLNCAYILGQMGRTEEASALLMADLERAQTPEDKADVYDRLGRVYLYDDPSTALKYYDEAERLGKDFGISHYCLKSRLLEGDKGAQRAAIGRAMTQTLAFNCSDEDKGVAYTELGAFMASVFGYKEADRLFHEAYHYFRRLEPADLRRLYLNRHYARNCIRLGRRYEAMQTLMAQGDTVAKYYGEEHPEYKLSLMAMLQVGCEHPDVRLNEEYGLKALEESRLPGQEFEYQWTKAAVAAKVGGSKDALALLEGLLTGDCNPMERLRAIEAYERLARTELPTADYLARMTQLVPQAKSSIISGLVTISGREGQGFHGPLSALIDGAISRGAYEQALELSLFRKGLLFTKKKAIEQEMASNPSTAQDYSKLQAARARLNAAIAYNDSTNIPALAAAATNLELELSARLARESGIGAALDRTTAQVSNKLGTNDLAVEFVRYSADGEPRYGAFLVDSGGFRQFVDIASEEELAKNQSLTWNSIAPCLPPESKVYFCPDGLLNNYGIEYLSAVDNQSIRLHRVFHLAEITPEPYGLGNGVVIAGVADHNSPINSGLAVNRGNWTDLPNVEYEIQLVSQALRDVPTTVLFDDSATEPALAALDPADVTTLHISTHGFYRSHNSLIDAAKDPTADYYNIARRFLAAGRQEVSGLVLREGNISWRSPFILEEHDDLWTAEEIELLSFPKLNLTVLSACETGLGAIDGDGVWGLSRAFRIAGAKSLICSLTKVDDYWTAQFMESFYEEAARGNNIYASFHAARRRLRSELPDDPQVWTSFILIE